MRKTDVAPLWNSPGCDYNAGFVVVKPSDITRTLYRMIWSITSQSTETDDQRALNDAIEALQSEKTSLRVTELNERRFLSGYEYFQKPRRWFASNVDDRCSERNYSDCAVVVHNNWIVSKAAKIYRFRENLMWYYDGNDQYYTSTTRRYLIYVNEALKNPEFIKKKRDVRVASEISALKTAMTMGYLLDRTVILPKFRIGKDALEYPLNSFIHVKTFNGQFSGRYREHSFLRHPKVPDQVKSELHTHALVMTKVGNSGRGSVAVSRFEILRQFGKINASVLAISSPRDVNVVLGTGRGDVAFSRKLHRGFLRSKYKQGKRW